MKKKIIRIIVGILLISGIVLIAHLIWEDYRKQTEDLKPIIYVYPEEEKDVSITVDYNGQFTHIYPKFTENSTWKMTAKPDGTLTDASGKEYYALFWEGSQKESYKISDGFCIKGSETEKFLEEKLHILGLNDREINEFIIYWLPQMENNPYNIIRFQYEDYTKNARLIVSPKEDSMIRVFMTWYPSETKEFIPTQTLVPAKRRGFTIVEWGGSKIK